MNNQLARLNFRKWAQTSEQRTTSTARTVAPLLIAFAFSTLAHAQGTMSFSGAQTLMGTFQTFALYAGAVICLRCLIFAGIRLMSGRFQEAIPALFGALFGAAVLGWGAGWISGASTCTGASRLNRGKLTRCSASHRNRARTRRACLPISGRQPPSSDRIWVPRSA